jgi:hypothetical protein
MIELKSDFLRAARRALAVEKKRHGLIKRRTVGALEVLSLDQVLVWNYLEAIGIVPH